MELLKRILKGAATKTKDNQNHLESQVREKLKSIVYEDELVEELLPSFLALQGNENFNTVMELLETKEAQIEAMAGGDWFKKSTEENDSTLETKQEEATSENEVDKLLKSKYGE